MARENLLNKEFGELKVIDKAEDYVSKTTRRARWKCLCSCGKIILVTTQKLKDGQKSCGHERKERCRVLTKKRKLNNYDLTKEYGIGYTSNSNHKFYFDLEDYEKIKNYTWHSNKIGKSIYIRESSGIYLHDIIMDIQLGEVVDHINHNPYDCRKQELRKCSIEENDFNKKPKNKYNCNGIVERNGRWGAQIQYKRHNYWLGTFSTKEEAIKARKDAEEKYYGNYQYKETN